MTDKRSALAKKYAPMTKKQLQSVVIDYASHFPGWVLFPDGTALTRCSGPIQQMIWFQKMSSAAYRPTHSIGSLVLSCAHIRMLPQMLDVKHREVEVRWHGRKWRDTLTAMEEQFKPDIRKPLDIAEILVLCEAEARQDATNDLTMLAILYAWLGRDAQALDCCQRMQHCPLPKLAPIPEWEDAMRAFGIDLANAIRAGRAKQFLEAAIERKESAIK